MQECIGSVIFITSETMAPNFDKHTTRLIQFGSGESRLIICLRINSSGGQCLKALVARSNNGDPAGHCAEGNFFLLVTLTVFSFGDTH